MFFAQEILFKDGPLAFIWMAGNGEFKAIFKAIKNRRNKNYVAMLQVNIGEVSDLIRKHFPQMGTAYGMSLKKASVLMKGLSVIYLSQLQHLSWTMHETQMRMQRANVGLLKNIDLPDETSRRRRGPAPIPDLVVEPEPIAYFGFGDLNETSTLFGDDIGPRCFTTNHDVSTYDQVPQRRIIATPGPEERGNRGKKRRRQEVQENSGLDEDGVLETMRAAVAQNQNAHTIRDVEPIPNPSLGDGFGDFGQGIDYMMPDMDIPVTADVEIPEMVSAEERGNRSPDERGRGTTRDLDDGQGRHAQRHSRRRLLSENDFDIAQRGQSSQEIVPPGTAERQEGDLELGSLNIIPRRRRVRRHPLDIDLEPQIPMDVIRQRIENQRTLNHAEGHWGVANDRVEEMNKKKKEKITEFMFGKYNFRGLKEDSYKRKTLSGFGDFVARAHDVALQERREDRPASAAELGDGNGSGTREEIQPATGAGNILNDMSSFGIPEMDPMIAPDMENEYQPEMDNPQITDENPSVPEDDTHGGGAVIDELGRGRFVFKQLFPPTSHSKKKAASAFFHLLRMQSEHKVILEQEEPFGDIYVTKL